MIIGAQLYSVKVKCTTEEGIRETFKVMKEQGYESVQMSGFDYDAEKVKLYAEEFDLHVGLTHTAIPKIINETDEVIRLHKIMGADVVGIGYPAGYMEDGIVNVDKLISDLQPAVEKIQAAGLGFGYHNHDMEFMDLGGYCTMDLLFEKTNWNFILDIGWCDVAGADVVSAIRKYASRLKYVHLKDFREAQEDGESNGSRIVPLYHGRVPLDAAIAALKEVGTVEVAYVEQDNASRAEDPYAEMKESIDQLKARGWVKNPMYHPIKLGIVGLGRAGFGMHTRELSTKADKFQIVAACDIIPERVQKTVDKYGCKGYDNIDDLIADPQVEMVDIATRTSQHYEHALKALKAGKDVLLEKPMSMNYDQAAELFSLANKPGMPRLFIRQNRRFEPVYNIVKDTIDSGILGTVFEVNISQLSYQRRNDWQTLREFGGGQALNWGPHIIDHSLMLLESEVKEQHGDIRHAVAGGDCEDHFWIHFIGENGRKVNMCISGGCALNKGRRFLVYGNRGAMECNESHVHLKYIDPEQVMPPVIANPGTPGASFGSTGTFASAEEIQWIEKEYEAPKEDLTVIWDYIYESYRNGADYPIKDKEVLNMMKVITRLLAENRLIDSTALRDELSAEK